MATPQPQSELTKGNVQAQNAGGQRPSSDTSRGTSLTVVGNKFRVGRKIGEGSFGIIYEGVNMVNNQKVAIKFEPGSQMLLSCGMNTELIKLCQIPPESRVYITLEWKVFIMYWF